jgi:hypothetical protein
LAFEIFKDKETEIMTEMPFIPNPRYMDSKDKFKKQQMILEDVSTTQRQPYALEHEINLQRNKMNP